jgi:hypothetical protein
MPAKVNKMFETYLEKTVFYIKDMQIHEYSRTQANFFIIT